MVWFKEKQSLGIITGIDVGSTSVRIAVGEVKRDGFRQTVQLLGAVEVLSTGVQRGIVTSIEEIVSSLSSGLEHVERITGIPVERAWVGLTGTHVIAQSQRGVVATARQNGEIGAEDVLRAVEAAKTIAPPLNYEMIHILPRRFTVDGQTGITDPVGMTGIRLEVDAHIIHGLTTHLKHLTKAVYRTGIEINDLVLSILAAASIVTTPKQRDLGVVVINIGSTVTSLVVYEEGEVLHIATIPIGSEHITNDIAIGLRTSIDIAEQVKIHYGDALSKHVSKKEKIDLATVGADVSEEVSRYFVAQIIEARVTELFEKIDEVLVSIHRKRMLPAGAVLTGGGAKLDGLIDSAKEILELPASLGYPIDVVSVSDKVHDIAFSTAIGLVYWGVAQMEAPTRRMSFRPFAPSSSLVRTISEHTKKFFKALIP